MDRSAPVSPSPGSGRLVQAGARASVVALAPLAVAVLRLFPALDPLAAGVGWLVAVAAAAAAAGAAGGMLAWLVGGVPRGSVAALLRAGGLGALTAGLLLAFLRALAEPAAFPDPGLAFASLAAALLLLAAVLAGDAHLPSRSALLLGGLAVFLAAEAALAGALVLAGTAQLGPWLLASAAAAAAAAALAPIGLHPTARTAPGLLAGAFAALSLARPGALEALPPMLALAAGGAAYAAAAAPSRRAALQPAAPGAVSLAEPHDRHGAVANGGPEEVRAEAARLARELRGTIDELLSARRTIELQRDELARAASVDVLTGAGSRRAILERVALEVAAAGRYNHPVALVLLDIDGFAALNHRHGRAVGDEVLREVALRMRLRVRAADALGRIGPDSFLAILPHTDERGAAVFADVLRGRLLSRPVGTAAGELSVAVSIGVALMRPGMALGDEELLAAAEEALASARAAGGNRIAFDRLHGLARLDERRLPRDSRPSGGGAADDTR